MEFFSTALIVLLLLAAVFFAARKLYRDKKQGRSCCDGNCPACAARKARRTFDK